MSSPASSHRKSFSTDVLVCGGGCAGIAAALSAARQGAKVVLVEKAPFAGGIITCVGLPFFDGMLTREDPAGGRVVIRGIALELLNKSGVGKPDMQYFKRPPESPMINNTHRFKVLLDRLLLEQKDRITVLFNSMACGVKSDGERIESVQVANKDGLTSIRAKVVIDCTGDGDVAAWAGAPFEQNAEVQPLTLHFRIGKVQHASSYDEMTRLCGASLARAQAAGELPYYYGPGVGFSYGPDEVYIHAVRVPANPTDAVDLSRAEMQGRADAYAMYLAWKRDVPQFVESYFMESYPWIGVRESRRLVGQHVLHEDELMAGCRFDDAIATGTWYLDLHPNKVTVGSANDFNVQKASPPPYDIPYRSLVPQKIGNLLVAGRCHSATRRAHSSTRVTCTAMAMGEAAAHAAVISMETGREVPTLDGVKVRERLAASGAGPFTDA